MSSGENFFKAPKPSRNASFADGQPAAPTDNAAVSYAGTPFGDDGPTHFQPADLADATGVMPGENQDPRFC